MVKLCVAAGCNTNNKVRFKKKKLLADKNNTFSFTNAGNAESMMAEILDLEKKDI